ncbi:HK97-gp10 family putative phage morphogenesis protein [Salipaludibacillus sp. CF4.18]|uniref:HK97-gp10 family putative phage morphogenesis protein n=1 Tax=Salipaludibacillus sp. CF4.18 TaxID=3373081 RepID=UPI003EE605C1
MAMPKTVTKVTKDGVKFTSNVDKIQYSLKELKRAALRDCAKLIRKRMIQKLKKLPGMKKSRRIYKSTQYWVRKWEGDLQIGFKHDTWYGSKGELGTSKVKKRGILRETAFENIDEMQRIQGKYLSAIENENKVKGLIDEDEYTSNDKAEK